MFVIFSRESLMRDKTYILLIPLRALVLQSVCRLSDTVFIFSYKLTNERKTHNEMYSTNNSLSVASV